MIHTCLAEGVHLIALQVSRAATLRCRLIINQPEETVEGSYSGGEEQPTNNDDHCFFYCSFMTPVVLLAV